MQQNSSHGMLQRFFDSPHLTPFLCLYYIAKYPDSIGIQFYLCNKLRNYSHSEIIFFLPQICQVLVTVKTESTALQEFLIEVCTKSVHCALLAFWQLEAYLHDFSHQPDSFSFILCKDLFNRIQYLMFNIASTETSTSTASPAPSIVAISAMLAAPAFPSLPIISSQMVLSQNKAKSSHDYAIVPTSSDSSTRQRSRSSTLPHSSTIAVLNHKSTSSPSTNSPATTYANIYSRADTISMPDLYTVAPDSSSTRSIHSVSSKSSSRWRKLKNSRPFRDSKKSHLSSLEKSRYLKAHYFHTTTQFYHAIQAISTRLIQVPKPARLSALRAELALLNNELPAEADLPYMIEIEGFSEEPKLSRIVRIPPAECTVLNSAERVPFLLLIEVLKNDLDFDIHSARNEEILKKRNNDSPYLFDLDSKTNLSPYNAALNSELVDNPAIVQETELGDLSTAKLSTDAEPDILTDVCTHKNFMQNTYLESDTFSMPGADRSELYRDVRSNSPRSSSLSFSSSYPTHRRVTPRSHAEVTDVATQMRTASIMLAQLDGPSGSKLPKDQVASIKARIISSMQDYEEHSIFSDIDLLGSEAGDRRTENDFKTGGIASHNSDDPSAASFGEEWQKKRERIRQMSPYGHLPNWELVSVIAKTGSDLRQEALACQLIQACAKLWRNAEVDVWVRPMKILITGEDSGLMETITNGISIHSLKKALTSATVVAGTNPKGNIATLKDYFVDRFGEPEVSETYIKAQREFMRSLVAYSLICYILQIKDRHNGNILLDNQGHIIHIDFGFMLSNSPGRVGFEAVPFKFTYEYLEILGGEDSEMMNEFRSLMKQAFLALRKNADYLVGIVEMMQKESTLPCFLYGPATSQQMRQRFQLQLSESDCENFVDQVLILRSVGSRYTSLYDQYQLLTQGIYS
ncbi:hypothetical protein CANCADRAFT_87083 [Tortispora caseinolytica NRRL Y-17796]|uniref:1-phosphatidylinositol 4-kinase n=1 Tax=Tortispora caseinolytica NRRL Y-17796 TaxID=767744 RepID=A0A1E4TL39_9ASCO|nr:hypothetical protein CANCADRAFT_87083 [Tortispora caseinolytica NRRL Y-17796]